MDRMAQLAHRTTNMPTTIVVGAGWAGLSCAYELCKAGHQVTILEAAPQIGGRARTIKYQDLLLDNGQHVGIGAYQQMRQLISELGLQEQQLFKILPQQLTIHGHRNFSLNFADLPPPFNVLVGVIFKSHLPWSFKIQICKFAYQIKKINFKLAIDSSILECLKSYHQSTAIINAFWAPLAVAIMSTPLHKASAQVFLNVLRQVFDASNNNSNWLLPIVDLSSILPKHLAQYLQQCGGRIECNQLAKRIQIHNCKSGSVYTGNAEWQAEHIVLAVPPWQAKTMLQPFSELQANYNALNFFKFEAITTLYYIFEQPIQLPYPLVGILNATCQWIFDRGITGQPNILSAIITGLEGMNAGSRSNLEKDVFKEILRHFPWLPEPISCKTICEKRAAFSCDVAIQQHRPTPNTAIQNLWLCGDYLQTGLPATLEGALLSGKKTARALLNISPRSNQNC
jgi:squalene-associated FAD-dependent desaturase